MLAIIIIIEVIIIIWEIKIVYFSFSPFIWSNKPWWQNYLDLDSQILFLANL